MANFTPYSALIGGALIGLSATLFLLFNGRLTGISGIMKGVFLSSASELPWRLMFLIGLVAGPAILKLLAPEVFTPREGYPLWMLVTGGLLVGIGTSMGNGCTSGHGVCGIARLSPRSIVATLTFMAAGMLTVFMVRHLIGVSA